MDVSRQELDLEKVLVRPERQQVQAPQFGQDARPVERQAHRLKIESAPAVDAVLPAMRPALIPLQVWRKPAESPVLQTLLWADAVWSMQPVRPRHWGWLVLLQQPMLLVLPLEVVPVSRLLVLVQRLEPLPELLLVLPPDHLTIDSGTSQTS